MFRGLLSTASVLLFSGCLQLSGQVPNVSGHWQVDAEKSKFGKEKTLVLDIQQQGNTIDFTRTYQDDGGKQVSARFTCTTSGSDCKFDDNGHHAKVSLWYNGPSLIVLKTDGDKHDSTVEWHLKVNGDGNTMTVNREIMEPSEEVEKLVFTKSASIASR
jgi:hypothetical protein